MCVNNKNKKTDPKTENKRVQGGAAYFSVGPLFCHTHKKQGNSTPTSRSNGQRRPQTLISPISKPISVKNGTKFQHQNSINS